MNQGYKLRFDQLRDNDPTGPDNGTGSTVAELYPSAGHTRNVCLVWPDGQRVFLNYAYLTFGAYRPNREVCQIELLFTSHKVILHGYGLETLYMHLLDHLPRVISVMDDRYKEIANSNTGVVIGIELINV